MNKKEIEQMLEGLGVKLVKSNSDSKPMTEEELTEFRNMLSKTELLDRILKDRKY